MPQMLFVVLDLFVTFLLNMTKPHQRHYVCCLKRVRSFVVPISVTKATEHFHNQAMYSMWNLKAMLRTTGLKKCRLGF